MNVDLMNPFLVGNIDLEVNLSTGGYFFRVAELLPSEVPIDKKAAGIACGEEKTACSVRFGKFA